MTIAKKHGSSIVKGTKDGALYIIARELFAKKDVQELVLKLQESSIRKRIIAYKKASAS